VSVVLGIDIGGTGIKGAPVDTLTGELQGERYRIPTPKHGDPKAVLEVVVEIVGHFSDVHGPIGVTFPGVVINNVIHTAANVEKTWMGVDAHELFAQSLGRPVKMMNDADAAGLAEMRFGAGKGQHGVVIMLTMGTGIGSAVFLNGLLVPNTELGHLEIDGKDAETAASGRARDEEKLSWKKYAKRVEHYLSRLDALLWPDLVIIGGGISKESAKFLDDVKVRCRVVSARLLNNAGIVGTAVQAGEELGGTDLR